MTENQKYILCAIILLPALGGALWFASTQPSYEEKNVGGPTIEEIDAELATEEEIYAHIDVNGAVDRMAVVKWDFLIADSKRYGDPKEWTRVSTKGTVKKNYPAVGYTYDKTLDAFIPPKPYATATLDTTKARWIVEPANKQPASLEIAL